MSTNNQSLQQIMALWDKNTQRDKRRKKYVIFSRIQAHKNWVGVVIAIIISFHCSRIILLIIRQLLI